MIVKCEKYPALWVPAHGVQFVDGVAEVSEAVAKALLSESPHITAEPEPDTKPRGRK